MSDIPVRIALVAEGPTDKIVIKAAIESVLGDRQYIINQLQPESSIVFGPTGTGWGGVYKWCKQATERSSKGALRNDPLFQSYDILVIHIDADVADMCYADANIKEVINDLPCAQPCPPPSATTDALRKVVLRWIGETTTPPKTAFCTPSKNAEAWVLAALFPADKAVVAGNLECFQDPESRLSQQPLKKRIRKRIGDYSDCFTRMKDGWGNLANLSEVVRFSEELRALLPIDELKLY